MAYVLAFSTEVINSIVINAVTPENPETLNMMSYWTDRERLQAYYPMTAWLSFESQAAIG